MPRAPPASCDRGHQERRRQIAQLILPARLAARALSGSRHPSPGSGLSGSAAPGPDRLLTTLSCRLKRWENDFHAIASRRAGLGPQSPSGTAIPGSAHRYGAVDIAAKRGKFLRSPEPVTCRSSLGWLACTSAPLVPARSVAVVSESAQCGCVGPAHCSGRCVGRSPCGEPGAGSGSRLGEDWTREGVRASSRQRRSTRSQRDVLRSEG
jgi:hypothetical protein